MARRTEGAPSAIMQITKFVSTRHKTIEDYLRELCAGGKNTFILNAQTDADGNVSINIRPQGVDNDHRSFRALGHSLRPITQ